MLRDIIKSMRPEQWAKNLFVFAAVMFTGNLTNPPLIMRSILAFIIFCGLSGAIYIINDMRDIGADRNHPKKKARPIASGKLQQSPALVAAISIALASLGLSFFLPINFIVCASAYLLLLIAYSLFLKSLLLIDAIVISFGFVLRLLAGNSAISILSTPWAMIMTFFLAMFISLIKRKAEGEILGDTAVSYRRNLVYYKKASADYIIIILAASVIISYTLFTLLSGKNINLYLTIPFVLYGVFRYIYLVFEKNMGADPSSIFIHDRPLFFCIMSWAAASAIIIYFA